MTTPKQEGGVRGAEYHDLERVPYRQRLVEDAYLRGECSEKNLREHLRKLRFTLVDCDARVAALARSEPTNV